MGQLRLHRRFYVGDAKEETYDTILDELGNKKTIILYKDQEDIPDEIGIDCDAMARQWCGGFIALTESVQM